MPKLTGGSGRRSEQTAVQHSVGRLAKKSTFTEDEEVIVYDLKSKLSSKGKITEVLGNNTYLANCGKGPQHISGDVISRISEVAKRQVGGQFPEVPVEKTGILPKLMFSWIKRMLFLLFLIVLKIQMMFLKTSFLGCPWQDVEGGGGMQIH